MRSDPEPARRLLAHRPAELAVPQPVLAELRYGISRLPRSRRREQLEARLNVILLALARAPWTDEVSRRFGELKSTLERRGVRVDDFDVAIAAHALAGDATIVTDNVRHFARMPGLRVESWS